MAISKPPNLGQPQRILIGVFTVFKKFERRMIIRSIYNKYKPPYVDVRFIMGYKGKRSLQQYEHFLIEAERDTYKDLIFLDIGENINMGKSWYYFHYVTTKLRNDGYVFVFKSDDDSLLLFPNLELRFNLFLTVFNKSTYYGFVANAKGIFYAMGGLYGMTWELCEVVTNDTNRNRGGAEDLMIGSFVYHTAQTFIHDHGIQNKPIENYPMHLVMVHGFKDNLNFTRAAGRYYYDDTQRNRKGNYSSFANYIPYIIGGGTVLHPNSFSIIQFYGAYFPHLLFRNQRYRMSWDMFNEPVFHSQGALVETRFRADKKELFLKFPSRGQLYLDVIRLDTITNSTAQLK